MAARLAPADWRHRRLLPGERGRRGVSAQRPRRRSPGRARRRRRGAAPRTGADRDGERTAGADPRHQREQPGRGHGAPGPGRGGGSGGGGRADGRAGRTGDLGAAGACPGGAGERRGGLQAQPAASSQRAGHRSRSGRGALVLRDRPGRCRALGHAPRLQPNHGAGARHGDGQAGRAGKRGLTQPDDVRAGR